MLKTSPAPALHLPGIPRLELVVTMELTSLQQNNGKDGVL